VFDRSGRIVVTAQQEHEQIYPRPGWMEHDPEEIWRRTQAVVQEALAQRGLRREDLAAIGIANQRETTVVWDRRTSAPLANVIVWQDARVADYVAELELGGHEASICAKTGLPLTTYFSALKLRWILDHVPDARAKAESGDTPFGTIDSFLAWQLTGLHLTDVTKCQLHAVDGPNDACLGLGSALWLRYSSLDAAGRPLQ
jgi:glycerol kinase